ncbi:hypothetical protein QVZ41_01175 [Wenyingzhuangia sp. chi5]|uniref:Glycosyltransferase involved in cell wall biosynthesis n=1 Tax=Wenyingzhuangia gilva TaxID=3057677 RepID=A0ABT8VNA2_9FLAO|nr:hypothetical protein [Wenyingzhuangia sp. chi5]MDO3693458.1 hypothetical protein [Wenyingzhuangia sp. chi5]
MNKNTQNLPKIALIEFDQSHAECLYSQILFLKEQYQITVFINDKSPEDLTNIPNITLIPLNLEDKKTNQFVKKYLISEKISKVIFNSAERKIFKFLLLFLFKKQISFWGILHNPNRLKKSLKQKYISHKLNGYFVLSDFVKENIITEKLTKTPVKSIYTIFFKEENINKKITKPKNETWLVIPGKVEFDRRDYLFLLNLKIPKNIKFIILGNINTSEGIQFKEKVIKNKLLTSFIFFETYIQDYEFSHYIENADFILPLIHPNNPFFNKYIKNKITGTYNWAYAFKKTMLLEQSFSSIDEFKETSYFYNITSNQIFEVLKQPKKKYISDKWSFDYQQNTYLNFIKTK